MDNVYSRKVVKDKYDFIRDVPDNVMKEYARIVLGYSKPNSRILELGFGTGQLLIPLVKLNKNAEIFGIDSSKEMLSEVKRVIADSEAKLINADLSILKKEIEKYDLMHFKAILHCVSNPEEALDTISNSVKKGGLIITSHEESQSEDRLEQIFKYCVVEDPELEMVFKNYFQLRADIGKSFKGRKFPAGNSYEVVKYLTNNKSFRLVDTISNKKLTWTRKFKIQDVLDAMRIGTFTVFYDSVTEEERETIYSKMINFTKKNKIDTNKIRSISAKFIIYILQKDD